MIWRVKKSWLKPAPAEPEPPATVPLAAQ